MDKKNTPRTKYITLFILIALSFCIGLVFWQKSNNETSEKNSPITLGGAYELVDQDGQTRTNADFNDKYKLIYFGFTYCPAVCPTELAKMSSALNMLEPQIVTKIQPIFISIDPERDTTDVVKNYISLFHKDFIGLTGSNEQIETVKKAYRVYAKKVEDETLNDYTMDHSSYIYFMSPSDKLIAMYRAKDTPQDIATAIKNEITKP